MLTHGMGIRLENSLAADQCQPEHDKSGFGQMEVCLERIGVAELVARLEEQTGIARASLNMTDAIRSALERAQ